MAQAFLSFLLIGLEILNVVELEATEGVFRWLVPIMLTTAFVMILAELTNPARKENTQRWWNQVFCYGLTGWIGILVISQWFMAAGFLKHDLFAPGRSLRLILLGIVIVVAVAGSWISKRRVR